jgi:exodeoxyribonuclease VII large subunit
MQDIDNEEEGITAAGKGASGDPLSLSELLERAEACIADEFIESEWVVVQITSINLNLNGHCYMDVVETDRRGIIVAKAKAIIWRGTYGILSNAFLQATGSPLQCGMKVLINCQVQFARQYGLSLMVSDIDPSYTLGEAEAERRSTIARLEAEGLMERNKELALPRLPRCFAVISNANAAGYGDFMKQLHQNGLGYVFHTELFEAGVQGKDAPSSMICAMERVKEAMRSRIMFDALLIMRGGGSAIDLSCFDDYNLCASIADFPIPVITGVGHDKDFHVCDMVASVNMKTPTAVADYILDIYSGDDMYLDGLSSRLSRSFRNKAAAMRRQLDSLYGRAVSGAKMRIREERHWLERAVNSMKSGVNLRLMQKANHLDKCELRLAANPLSMLGRGQAFVEGPRGRIFGVDEVKEGERITVTMKDGALHCTVNGKIRN